jgi:hypothetical protein
VKDDKPTKSRFAQVLNIIFRRWFPMDEAQHNKVDFEEAFDKDVLNEGKVNSPIRGDFETAPSSPHIQPVPVQI